MRILVVEDEASSRHMLMSFLKKHGECDSTEDGEEAVSRVQTALEANTPYDLICLDIKLPGMDGLAVLQTVRQHEEAAGIMPGDGAQVIMTTAIDDGKRVLQAFNEQCEVYLTKPISKQKLEDQLVKLGLI